VFESLHKWDGRQEIRLPTPQIKQIAGRAGRYGLHTPVSPSAPDLDPAEAADAQSAGDVLGEATTLDAVDLPILQDAMKQPTVQVTQASLSAPFDSFKALFALLPPTTPLSRIFALSRAITRTKPHYRATGTVQLGEVGDKIAAVKPLTFFERYTFGLAPVNTRDALVVDTLVRFAESYARGEKILMDQWGDEMGIYDLLDRVADAAAQQELARRESSSSSPQPDWKPTAAALLTRRQAAVFTPQMLQSLESYHRCLTLYLWLSYRLAPIFCDQPAARELRNRVEKAIETALAGIRFERVDRSRGAKRNKARFAAQEPTPTEEAGRPLDFLSMLEKQV
jgi:ATP-dependent RNA helicase SUPV3L1/SUV3